jgi:uncharacterized protein (TIGR02145 family)
MKANLRVLLYPLFFMVALTMLTVSCSEEETVIPPTAPGVLTSPVSEINETTATSGGLITSNGGAAITQKGICWSSTSQAPTTADTKTTDTISSGEYKSYLTGLTANTTYYVRAYAINSVGTSYGNLQTFKTLPVLFTAGGGVADIDGNNYATVIIGTQEWMVANLKTTKFNDGSAITQVTADADWKNLTTAGYCWYKNDETSYKNTYGALYNWYAANDSKLCPTGWHLPTNDEWALLEATLGGDTMVGGRMKEIGTAHWNAPNYGADNRGGFTALPAGYRDGNGAFDYMGMSGRWWSATELSIVGAWYRSTLYSNAQSQRGYGSKTFGYAIRCVKD